MKFRKRVKILPGVTLNLSRSGISTTVGIRGASVNVNRHGTFLNTGIPGTGLYDRQKISGNRPRNRTGSTSYSGGSNPANLHSVYVSSYREMDLKPFTSRELLELHDDISDCIKERSELFQKLFRLNKKIKSARFFLLVSKILIFGWVLDGPKRWVEKLENEYSELLEEFEACKIDVGIEDGQPIDTAFENLKQSFDQLKGCAGIWDVTHSESVNSIQQRQEGNLSIRRIRVKLSLSELDTLHSDNHALKFENANGGDFYLYPALILLKHSLQNFGLLGYADLKISISEWHYVENESVPNDAEIIRYTWFRANKDGSPDRRFKDNFQIPICRYGQLLMEGKNGLKEVFLFSNYNLLTDFYQKLIQYQKLITNH